MTVSRLLAAALSTAGLVALAAAAPACGIIELTDRDFGDPPDGGFNPGNGGGNDPYGYGGGQGAPFVCPDELKRCPHTFAYPDHGESNVELRGDFGGPDTWEVGRPMTKKGSTWTVEVNVPFGVPVQYKFVINGTTWKFDASQPTVKDGNNTNNLFSGTTCETSICEEEGQLPPGVFDWRDAVIYFVFVDRFLDGKPGNNCNIPLADPTGPIANYHGGDWDGVTKKINEGYFNELGVNTLWITVPFDNPEVGGRGVGDDSHNYSGYHGYWPKLDSDTPASLEHESCFGTFQELKDLIAAAHAKGLKVLFDYAMVHVHDTSAVWAQHEDWFWPNNNQFKGGNGDCICGSGCSWDALPDRERCWFTGYLPHWKYENPDALAYSVSNAVEWIKQTADSSGNGVDGFRADAIKHVDKAWLPALRAKIKTDVTALQTPPQRFYMVGETYDFGNRDVIKSYIEPNTKLDGQFDFPLRRHIVEALLMRMMSMSDLEAFMKGNDYFYGSRAVMSTFVGNHDLPRVIHLAANNRIFGDDQGAGGKERAWSGQPTAVTELEAYERLANAFAVLFTNRGAPLIYYGDEIGLAGAGDPDNRRPMPWAGYSAPQTYLLERLKRLGDIRSKHPALRRGIPTTLEIGTDVWLYRRATTGDEVFVAVNRSDTPRNVGSLPAAPLTELVTGQDASGPTASIPPRQTRIYVRRR